MMAAARAWLTAVVSVTLLLSVIQMLTPKGSLREITSFVGGLLLLAVLLRPLGSVDLSAVSLNLDAYRQTVEQRQAELEQEGQKELVGLIEAELESYILDKAADMGLTLRVQVTVEPDGSGVPVPVSVELTDRGPKCCPGGWKRSWASRRKDRCGMKTEGVRKLWDRYKYAALILLIGAGLLLWPGGSGHTAQTGQSEAPPAYTAAETLRKDLEEILGQIQGVGTVRVLLTVDTDGERQLAQNTELRYSGSATAPEDYSRTSEPVLLDGGGPREETVVTRTAYPTYRGALVVCQGGDRADVKLAVTEAVSALTGLSSDCVTVAKCQ